MTDGEKRATKRKRKTRRLAIAMDGAGGGGECWAKGVLGESILFGAMLPLRAAQMMNGLVWAEMKYTRASKSNNVCFGKRRCKAHSISGRSRD